ncbi:MAG: AAA family ATPase [Desulfobulbaceae bacterium]|nr:MAG: AAA family ATPase [Desulfobulbaceae bacterium]
MYRQHFGLLHKPFELTPDARALFLSESHKEALSVLQYGVVNSKGYLLLTGGVGTGKTTLLYVLTTNLNCSYHLCLLTNPALEIADFYYYVGERLGLPFDGNKAKFLIQFADFITRCRKEQSRILLIIDEAHALPLNIFQEIRFLSNLPPEDQAILSIFLVGQPELLDRLADERLLPLRQRIAIRFHIEPLTLQDTKDYILFRLDRAGASSRNIFTEKALERVYRETGGNPRLINILCDNALVSAYAADELVIDEGIIRACADEMVLPGERKVGFLKKLRKSVNPWWVAVAVVLCVVEIVGFYLGGLLNNMLRFIF